MCQLGYLYNREAVLECLKRFLVDDIPMPVVAAHISSLKARGPATAAPVLRSPEKTRRSRSDGPLTARPSAAMSQP